MPFLQTIGGGSVQGYKPNLGNQIIDATGGTTEEFTDSWGDKWKSHTFTSNGNFVVNSVPATDTSVKGNNAYKQIEILIVGGGGGGGGGHDADWFGGGGGGAGGVVLKEKYTPVASTYSITIGNGGSGGGGASNGSGSGGNGSDGGDTTAFGYTGKGGGGGAPSSNGWLGNNGGSGGGDGSSSTYYPGGQTTQNTYHNDANVYGSDGGHGYSDGSYPFGGGGGGAMGAGAPPMNESTGNKHVAGMGGKPIALKFQNNTMKTYAAGGGGGGAGESGNATNGGEGGRGYGHGDHDFLTTNGGGYGRGGSGNTVGLNGGSGTANFGHGGGGGGGGPAGYTGPAGNGGNGSSGVVVVRYLIEENASGAWRSDNNYYDGSSSAKAAECAADILAHNGAAGNGWYWIKPKWYPKDPFKVYCNMTADGGGWMRYGVAASTSGVSNRALVPFQCFYGGSNYYGPADTRVYGQESFSRFDIAKYHANHSVRDNATDSQLMWRRINNNNQILIHSIGVKFNSILGASEFGNDQEYTNNGESQATGGGNNATKGGYSPFKEDGSSHPTNWPQFNNGWRNSGGDGLKIYLMKMSNSGEGGIVTKSSGGSASSPTERYEGGPGYPGIAWNSSYNSNADNAGGFNNFINRRGLVYWETNGPSSSGQWFHGTVLAMGGSSGPLASQSRKDVEVFYRAKS